MVLMMFPSELTFLRFPFTTIVLLIFLQGKSFSLHCGFVNLTNSHYHPIVLLTGVVVLINPSSKLRTVAFSFTTGGLIYSPPQWDIAMTHEIQTSCNHWGKKVNLNWANIKEKQPGQNVNSVQKTLSNPYYKPGKLKVQCLLSTHFSQL